ncbi:MAG: response regulator transcription factor [Actinomycetota bacterium]|nr:response regulator transcription factor [Actinomycetota bacterium]
MWRADDRPRVLVVDDDRSIRHALERALPLEGFLVQSAEDGPSALERLDGEHPDLVVLDVVMPGLSGIEVTRRLRERGSRVPVCILSARDEVSDRVEGLRVGADDYLVKPFALEELVARLHALLRRSPAPGNEPLRAGDLVLDPSGREVHRGERTLDLTNREFELLSAFVRHPGQVLSRPQLLEQVWGYSFEVDGNVVDVFVSYLRRKLEAGGEPRILHTVRGVGFVLRP